MSGNISVRLGFARARPRIQRDARGRGGRREEGENVRLSHRSKNNVRMYRAAVTTQIPMLQGNGQGYDHRQ
jgi:hypothetical protein